ncbi:unnamed protein product [Scytosiphon promiscuus]
MSHGPSLLLPAAARTPALCLSRHALGVPPSALEAPMVACHDALPFALRVDGVRGTIHGYPDIPTRKVHGGSSSSSSRGSCDVSARSSGRHVSRQLSLLARVKACSVRGGCRAERDRPRRHRRARRPTASFVAPALVWVLAAVVDYDLWWRRGGAAPSALLPWPDDINFSCGSVRGRVAKIAKACGGHFVFFHALLCLALLSHVAATVADPGFFARDNGAQRWVELREPGRWCRHCEAYKPTRAHHCRRCKACVARMDHHCIYVANCVGAGNHKQLMLFVCYSLACVAHAASLYLRLYLRCGKDSHLDNALLVGAGAGGGGRSPARRGAAAMAGLLVVVAAFLAAVLTQQCLGIVADAGVIDRMQAAAADASSVPEYGAAEMRSIGSLPPTTAAAGPGTCRGVQETQPEYCPDAYARGEHGFQAAVCLPRGPFGKKTVSEEASSSWGARLGLAWRFLDKLYFRLGSCCRDLRQDVLGEGPWYTWFLPTAAVLSVEAEERAYAPHGKAARIRRGWTS